MVSGGGGWGAAESPAVCRAAPNRCAYRAEVAIPPEGWSSLPGSPHSLCGLQALGALQFPALCPFLFLAQSRVSRLTFLMTLKLASHIPYSQSAQLPKHI